MIRSDPFSGLSTLQFDTAAYAGRSDAYISVFRARWPIGTVQRACFELVFWSGGKDGGRRPDRPSAPRSHGLLVFRQSKTGGIAHAPRTYVLPAFAATWKAERDQIDRSLERFAQGMTYLRGARGAP